jgi:4-amino-4-deoxy-L-arabinose transferase-like glycosyltransferase
MRFIQPDLPLVWLTRSRLSPYVWILILWAVLTLPAIFLVGAHFEEGTTIGLARGAFEDGHWLVPHLYGYRFVEWPVLVSWILGGLGLVIGDFDLWVGRIPAVSALLGGALLICWFARRAVGTQGAVFAAACFLLAPMVLEKVITAENDSVVSVLLFVAFVIWWIGSARGGPSVGRWLVIGLVLAAAGLTKGPQPLGFFFVGVAVYLLFRRKWREFAGLVLTGLIPALVVGGWYWLVYQSGDLGTWQSQMRLGVPALGPYVRNLLRFSAEVSLGVLPGLVLVIPLAVDLWRHRIEANRELALALFSYAIPGVVVLLLWPYALTRYAMPIVPAVAMLAGIAYHHLLTRLPRLVLSAQFLAGGLLAYAVALNWVVMPLFPGSFAFAAGESEPITAAILERPAPVYVVPFAVSRGVLYYLPKPHVVPVEELARAKPPYWALMTPKDEEELKAARPDLEISLRLDIPKMGSHLDDVKKP